MILEVVALPLVMDLDPVLLSRIDPHCHRFLLGQYRREEGSAILVERHETAVQELIGNRGGWDTIQGIEPLLIRVALRPRFRMPGPQELGIGDAGEGAFAVDGKDLLAKASLPLSRFDDGLLLGIGDLPILADQALDAVPCFGARLALPFRRLDDRREGFCADQGRQLLRERLGELGQVDRLDAVAVGLQWGVLLR